MACKIYALVDTFILPISFCFVSVDICGKVGTHVSCRLRSWILFRYRSRFVYGFMLTVQNASRLFFLLIPGLQKIKRNKEWPWLDSAPKASRWTVFFADQTVSWGREVRRREVGVGFAIASIEREVHRLRAENFLSFFLSAD